MGTVDSSVEQQGDIIFLFDELIVWNHFLICWGEAKTVAWKARFPERERGENHVPPTISSSGLSLDSRFVLFVPIPVCISPEQRRSSARVNRMRDLHFRIGATEFVELLTPGEKSSPKMTI